MATPPIPPLPGNQPGPPPAFEQVIVPASAQPAAAYPPAPSQVYAPAPPPSSGNTSLKIILIVVGVFVALGVLAAAIIGIGVYKVSKAVNLHTKDGGVSITTPNGTITTGGGSSISPSDTGVPEYPGAKHGQGGMRMKSAEGSLVTATYTTTDSTAKVVDFYKAKLGDDASLMESNGNTVLTTGQNTTDKVVVTITPEGSATRIGLLHAKTKKP